MEELKENYIEEKMLGFFYFLLEAATSIISKKNPDVWNIHTIIFGQVMYHWKKALEKKQPYQFKWNQYMDKDLRDSYYYNWPVYFP